MTALGMVVTSPDRAIVWADTQTFTDGHPHDHRPKLIVNATARIVGCGTGWTQLMERFGDAVTRAMDVDELVEALPALLRRESAAIASKRPDPERFISNAFCVAGWSTRWGRLLGFALDASTYFEPQRVFDFASPASAELTAMGAASLDDVTGLILSQVADLGLKTTGAVLGATITASGITTKTLMHLHHATDAKERPVL